MAEYKDIHGTKIRNYTTNPDNPIVGEVWYNDNDNVLKFNANNVTSSGSWATGNNMSTARSGNAASINGTQTATITFGGNLPPVTGATESYNGATWSELNDLNNARRNYGGAGTQTAALGYGGTPAPLSAKTESWNGTNWTEVNTLNQGRRDLAGSGTNTSALGFGGYTPSPNYALTELWNGTNWTEVNDLNTARHALSAAGTDSTSSLAFGGYNGGPALYANTETWNGTNWTEVNDLNTARYYLTGAGAPDNALATGGYSATAEYNAITEVWNGTNWTEDGDLNTGRRQFAASGTGTSAVVSGGATPPPVSAGPVAFTEEWTGPGSPIGAWSTVNSMNSARAYPSGIGTYTSALSAGGTTPPGALSALTESYNGTNWTAVNDLNTGRFGMGPAGVSNTSGLVFGGQNPSLGPPGTPNNTGATESWGGTNWTEVNDLNSVRQDCGGFGTQTSALAFGGYKYVPAGRVAICESWNGSNWTEVNDMNAVRYKLQESGAGADNTSGICAGGDGPGGDTVLTEIWNGTNWTEVNDMNTPRANLANTGIATAALAIGGEESGLKAITEEWNGVSWTEVADLNTASSRRGSAGTTSNALAIGGITPGGNTTATEEWSNPSTSIKTVSTD